MEERWLHRVFQERHTLDKREQRIGLWKCEQPSEDMGLESENHCERRIGYYKGEMDGYLYLCGMGHCKETSYPKGAYISKTKNGSVYKVLKRSGSNTDTSQDSGFNVKPWDSKLGGLYETSELRGTVITLPSKHQCRFVPKLDDTYIPIGISINPS